MKKGMKRIVSAILAAMTAATLAVTAFAADYAMPPVFNDTPSETVSDRGVVDRKEHSIFEA